MKYLSKRIAAALLVVTTFTGFSNVINAQDGDATVQARGVAKFLLARADANIFYMFERQLIKDHYLQCLMPLTHEKLTTADENGRLKKLLSSSRTEWDAVVERDIADTQAKLLLILSRYLLQDVNVTGLNSGMIEFYQKLEVNVVESGQPQWQSLVVEPLHPTAYQRQLFDKLYALAQPLYDLYLLQQITFSVNSSNMKCLSDIVLTDDDVQRIQQSLNTIKQVADGAELQLQSLQQLIAQGVVRFNSLESLNDSLDQLLSQFSGLKESRYFPLLQDALTAYFDQHENRIYFSDRLPAKADNSAMARVEKLTTALTLVLKAVELSDLDFPLEYEKATLRRFIKHADFFAELADATDAESVEAILQSATLPDVSFGVKRTPAERDWLITSYLGFNLIHEKDIDPVSGNESQDLLPGVFAPIGMEWTFRKTAHGSFSAMLAPFDFGHAVNLEIHNEDEDIKVSDIVVPGLYLSWGVPDYPVTVGFGANRAKSLSEGDEQETRAVLFFAFDMPLWGLW